jgi:hypothetical protein
MKRKPVLAILLSLLLLISAAALADGDIYVGGPLGTKITRLPYTIGTSGAYYLGGNLSYSGGNGITIAADHVTLDLMGFTLAGPGSANSAIYMNGRTNVEIRNGTLTGWQFGIYEAGSGQLHRLINVRASGSQDGIHINSSSATSGGHLIKGCEATSTGSGSAIFVSGRVMVTGCTVNCTNNGIGIYFWDSGMASGNVVSGNSSSNGILINNNGEALLINNQVTGCTTGINCTGPVSAIGNAVNAASGQTGILVDGNDYPTFLDQNTVSGAGTHYSGTAGSYYRYRNNGG